MTRLFLPSAVHSVCLVSTNNYQPPTKVRSLKVGLRWKSSLPYSLIESVFRSPVAQISHANRLVLAQTEETCSCAAIALSGCLIEIKDKGRLMPCTHSSQMFPTPSQRSEYLAGTESSPLN
ncbi:hypothetical protein MRB53_029052 [Persea americana]|uniref:Uncharacterized protein n=1 Tax=Persea americana TaxID=3435 RepID=A0ACC2KHN5_PERAE|nr:hypothetical protein MRB53_029052 [Persea americana]